MTWVRQARGLYAIIDPEHCVGPAGPREPIEVAEAVLAGGCAVLQLRAKRLDAAAISRLGAELRDRCRRAGVPFVLNDHVELALALDADGLHLGQDDMSTAEARQAVGAMPIGLSTHDLPQARAAAEAGADLIGFGPVFDTGSKERPDPTVGPEGLSQVLWEREEGLPVVAIGGITVDNVERVAAMGVPLVAVIGAICRANDPQRASQLLHAALHAEPAKPAS
ncbi:MAG: thiamine phosphate synthase [Myxococcales bacterium]